MTWGSLSQRRANESRAHHGVLKRSSRWSSRNSSRSAEKVKSSSNSWHTGSHFISRSGNTRMICSPGAQRLVSECTSVRCYPRVDPHLGRSWCGSYDLPRSPAPTRHPQIVHQSAIRPWLLDTPRKVHFREWCSLVPSRITFDNPDYKAFRSSTHRRHRHRTVAGAHRPGPVDRGVCARVL